MARGRRVGRWRFWALALAWLPAGLVAQAMVRFGADWWVATWTGGWLTAVSGLAVSLAPAALCGLPLALGCRRLWWLGYRRAAWLAAAGLGGATEAGALVAGLFGPVAIAVCAVALSIPVWIAWYWLLRRG